MDVDTIAIGLVFLPLALVDVTIGMPELSSSVGLVLTPLTFVLGAVGPDLDTGAMPHAILQVAAINGSVLKDELVNELQARALGSRLKASQQLVVGKVELSGA